MKYKGIIKFVLIIFIIVAIFNYRGDSLNDWAIKTGVFLRGFSSSSVEKSSPIKLVQENVKSDALQELNELQYRKPQKEEGAQPKVTSNDDSIVGTFIANVLNKVLETPNGQVLLKETIGRAASRNEFSQGQDIAERKYLALDAKIGKGREVKCGDEVEISYNIYKPSDRNIKNKSKLKTRILIGRNSLPKPFEGGLIGMREGGDRRLLYFVEDIFKADKKNDNKSDYKQLISEVSLKKIHTPKVDTKDYIRIFVHNPSKVGKRILCGDDVHFIYKVTDIHNNLLSDEDGANRLSLNVYHAPKSPLRSIYNSLVDVYADHVRLSAIMTYDQARKLIPDFKVRSGKKMNASSLVIVDLYGVPSASFKEMQMGNLFGRVANVRQK